jgi:hypothetical protein
VIVIATGDTVRTLMGLGTVAGETMGLVDVTLFTSQRTIHAHPDSVELVSMGPITKGTTLPCPSHLGVTPSQAHDRIHILDQWSRHRGCYTMDDVHRVLDLAASLANLSTTLNLPPTQDPM